MILVAIRIKKLRVNAEQKLEEWMNENRISPPVVSVERSYWRGYLDALNDVERED